MQKQAEAMHTEEFNSISLAEKPITSLSQEKGEAATGDEANLHSSCQMKPLNLQPSVEMHQTNRESRRHLYKQREKIISSPFQVRENSVSTFPFPA